MQLAPLRRVRSHICHGITQLNFRFAVDENQRDVGALGGIHHWLHALGIYRVEDNGIHPQVDKIVHLLHLQRHVAFGIDKLAIHVQLLKLAHHLRA
ncbi:hypothetical protein D3C79_496270 [compost metagenome]